MSELAQALEAALRAAVEYLIGVKPAGHDGDEESGVHDDTCQLCAWEGVMAQAEAAIRQHLDALLAVEAPPVGVSPQPNTHLQAFDIMQAWVNRGCTVPDCRPCFECLQALHKVIRDALESPASLSPVEAAGRSQ